MTQPNLNWIANYIWGIADDVLRDVYVRGKYRDVILPMTVLRRLDAVLEPTKRAVLNMKESLDDIGVVDQKVALRGAAGQAFYNTSKFTLHDLRARASRQQLRADFEDYLDGFSPSVQDILDNFEFRNQIPRLSKADALGSLIEKLTSPRCQPGSRAGHGHRRHRPASRTRQPRHGDHLRGADPALQRGEQRGGGRALHPARRRAAHVEAGIPAGRRRDRRRHLPALRRRLRDGRHAYRGRGRASADREGAGQAGLHPPLRPGDQRRDLRHLQGRPPAEGRGGGRRQHRGRPGTLDPLERRLPDARVRLHALQPTVREELEDRPAADGRQEGDARPPVPDRARGRPRLLPGDARERRPTALPGQQALQDEARDAPREPHRRGPTTAAPSSPARRDRARATSAAGSSRTTGWRRSSRCR